MAKKSFKLYTQPGHFLPLKPSKPKRSWLDFVMGLILFIVDVLYGLCLRVGQTCYRFAVNVKNGVHRQLRNTASNFQQRAKLVRQPIFAKALMIFLVVSMFCYGALSAFRLLARALEFKNQLVSLGSQGTEALVAAKTDLQNKDFSSAQSKFQLAYNSFSGGQRQFQQENFLLNQVLELLPQKQDADKLLTAAALLSTAGSNMTEVYQDVSQWNLSPAGLSASGGTPLDLAALNGKVDMALSQVDQAGELLSSVDPNSLPKSYQEKIVAAQDNFIALQKAFHSLSDLLMLADGFAAKDKHLLLLLENNNELRPTGGFIGTFGDIKIHEGSIKAINISSIYDLDGQLTRNIEPPFPMLAVNDRWFLRDSNWFADFPQSARKISDFYELEGGETPDEIIALTPTVIQNFLKLTGPITLPRYNVTLDADNFVEVTQVESSVNYSRVDNKPKQILADLAPVLLSRLGSLPKDQLPQLLQTLQDSLNQKQLVLYSRQPDTEAAIAAFNWDGGLRDSDRDYLGVVAANLNGSKTDLYLKQAVSLKTTIGDSGKVIDELTITRTNSMPDLPDTANTSFIRVFVPAGSHLVSNLGFDYNVSTLATLPGDKVDPDVAAWEKTIVTDLVSGTSIGQEAGKTFFGNWLTVKGGQTKSVTLVYELPFTVAPVDRFSLLLQKQTGALPSDFSYELSFPSRHLLWQNYQPTTLDTGSLNFSGQINQDYLLGEVFQHS